MKKKLLALCMTAALIIASVGGVTAFAEVSLEQCDKCFQTTVNGFLEDGDVDGNTISAVRKPVYDINLQHLGYVYEFEIICGNSYAIIICDEGNYVAQEFVPGSESPYSEVGEEQTCVYVNSMIYLKHDGEAFLDIQTSAEVPEEVIDSLSENAILYSESYDEGSERVTVTIEYQSRVPTSKSLCARIPNFQSPGNIKSACAAVAACNIIGFYDRYYEDLIPNHAAGYEAYGNYFYNLADEYVDNATRELYSLMNGSEAGISEKNFTNGMQTYCANKNLTCDFTQLLSSGKLSTSAIKQSIDENKPIALLLSTYTVCDIILGENYDKFVYDVYKGDHIMVGFGYCNLAYKLSDGSDMSYDFIYVSSGFDIPKYAYFNINYCTNINSAYKVYIH